MLDPPILFAHRGARAHAAENTLEAFSLALRLGATGLESDVWLTADGVPVLDHDGLVRQRVRRLKIRSLMRHQLPPHIPSLTDLFSTCGTDFHLSLDLKDPEAVKPVLDVVGEHAPGNFTRTWLCHPDEQVLGPIGESEPAVRLVLSSRLPQLRGGPEMTAARLRQLGIDAINLHHTDWTGGLVTLFHRFEVLAFGWDLQFEHVLTPAIRMGVDAVYSDHVDLMVDSYQRDAQRR